VKKFVELFNVLKAAFHWQCVMCITVLVVTGGGSVGECGRLSQPRWLLGAL